LEVSPQHILLLGQYLGAGIALGLGGVGAAIGMGMAAGAADRGIMRQPRSQGIMLRTMLIGQAVGGSPSIFALVVGLLIMFKAPAQPDLVGWSHFSLLVATGLAVGLGCFGSGWGCGYPAAFGCAGVARNPREIGTVASRMIIGQAVAQSPAIFATVVSLILLFVFERPGFDWRVIGMTLGAGFAIGAGSLGSGFGSGYAAGGAIDGIGRWPANHGITLRTMLVGQGVCQTSAIFGLLVAFILLFTGVVDSTFLGFSKALAAGLAVGFGGIGPGIGTGLVGGAACEHTAIRPRYENLLLRTMLTGQAVSQSTAIYALIVALVILYVA
jgi:F0F1-type ATP synthase membrane subunit c/vacuolar-type H+-ATPase subunit K